MGARIFLIFRSLFSIGSKAAGVNTAEPPTMSAKEQATFCRQKFQGAIPGFRREARMRHRTAARSGGKHLNIYQGDLNRRLDRLMGLTPPTLERARGKEFQKLAASAATPGDSRRLSLGICAIGMRAHIRHPVQPERPTFPSTVFSEHR
jgi:hypothetical protein